MPASSKTPFSKSAMIPAILLALGRALSSARRFSTTNPRASDMILLSELAPNASASAFLICGTGVFVTIPPDPRSAFDVVLKISSRASTTACGSSSKSCNKLGFGKAGLGIEKGDVNFTLPFVPSKNSFKSGILKLRPSAFKPMRGISAFKVAPTSPSNVGMSCSLR